MRTGSKRRSRPRPSRCAGGTTVGRRADEPQAPRASAGLSSVPASIAPPSAHRLHDRVQLVDEQHDPTAPPPPPVDQPVSAARSRRGTWCRRPCPPGRARPPAASSVAGTSQSATRWRCPPRSPSCPAGVADQHGVVLVRRASTSRTCSTSASRRSRVEAALRGALGEVAAEAVEPRGERGCRSGSPGAVPGAARRACSPGCDQPFEQIVERPETGRSSGTSPPTGCSLRWSRSEPDPPARTALSSDRVDESAVRCGVMGGCARWRARESSVTGSSVTGSSVTGATSRGHVTGAELPVGGTTASSSIASTTPATHGVRG